MGGIEDLITLLGGPFVLFTIYGWLRLTRGVRVVRPEDPEFQVVTTLAVFDVLGRRGQEIGLGPLADAILTSRYVEVPETTHLPTMGPMDAANAVSPTWTLEAKRLLGLAASRYANQGLSLVEAILLELQSCDDAEVAAKVAGARALPSPQRDVGVSDPAVILHNDDTTTMDAVTELLMTYAGLSRRQATYLMLTVHHHGRAAVPDCRVDAARPLADALELGAYDLKMRRLKMTVEANEAA